MVPPFQLDIDEPVERAWKDSAPIFSASAKKIRPPITDATLTIGDALILLFLPNSVIWPKAELEAAGRVGVVYTRANQHRGDGGA